ncbi:MAG: hypothetical protein NTX25_03375 [Proteobacteria bacterium]|nr:hypothetical protein [Pseudomonadota bacterium]
MNFQRITVGITLVLAPYFIGISTSYSQELDIESTQLNQMTQVKNVSIEIDHKVTDFVSQYLLIMADFEQTSNKFQTTTNLLQSNLKTRIQGINELNNYMSSKFEKVMASTSKADDINRMWEEFRLILNQKNPCDSTLTAETYSEAMGLAVKLQVDHSALLQILAKQTLPSEHSTIVEAARQGVNMMSSNLVQVNAMINSLKGAADIPKVCDSIRSFDIILALASVAAEANQSATELDKINIGSFLDEINAVSLATQAMTSARHMLTSYEAYLIKSIRAGYLNKTLSISESYKDTVKGITKSLHASNMVPASEKTALELKASQTQSNIETEINNAKIMQIDGRRNLLLTRGRNLYAAINRVTKESFHPDTETKKKELLDYCNSNLNMVPPGRYLVPETPTFEAELELDRKFERADQLLKSLEGR